MTLQRKRHDPASVWQVPAPFRPIYAHAVEVAGSRRMLMVSGQLGITPDGGIAADFPAQLGQALANVEALLASAGMTRAHIVKATFFLTRTTDLPALGEVRRRLWASEEPPAVTALVVAALARPDCLVEVEVMAAE